MAASRVKSDAAISNAGVRLIACVIVAGCIFIVLTAPTPAPPRELPCLVVRRAEDLEQLARLRARARRAPNDVESRALRRFVAQAGLREAHRTADLGDEEAISRARVRAVVARDGIGAVGALRAKSVLEFIARFDPREPRDPRLAATVGGFGVALERWGALREGRLVAPALVVRALYAARWNVIVRLAPTSGFSKGELRAYYGWLALHAPEVPTEMRRRALVSFAEVDPSPVVDEAVGDFLFAGGAFASAQHAFERVTSRTGSLRVRNAALASHQLAQ